MKKLIITLIIFPMFAYCQTVGINNNKLIINSTGNVGIGTSTPTTNLKNQL